jgi:hypothetical protein
MISWSSTPHKGVVGVVAEISWLAQGPRSSLPSLEFLHPSVDSIHLLLQNYCVVFLQVDEFGDAVLLFA